MESKINSNANTNIKENISNNSNLSKKKKKIANKSQLSQEISTNNNTRNTNSVIKYVIGSYEGRVFCLEINLKNKDLNQKNSYSFKVSDNSLKSITNYNSYAFVSGNDEILHIFDTNKKEEKGQIVTYNGSVQNLIITKRYLFISGDDPSISIFLMKDFSFLFALKGHKSSVLDILMHNSKKFLLSTAKDSSLIIWNLLTGLKIVKYNFKEGLICKKLLFANRKEEQALLVFENEIWVFDIFKETEDLREYVTKKQKFESRILSAFVFKDCLAILFITGKIRFYKNFEKKEDNNEEFEELDIEKPENQQKGKIN